MLKNNYLKNIIRIFIILLFSFNFSIYEANAVESVSAEGIVLGASTWGGPSLDCKQVSQNTVTECMTFFGKDFLKNPILTKASCELIKNSNYATPQLCKTNFNTVDNKVDTSGSSQIASTQSRDGVVPVGCDFNGNRKDYTQLITCGHYSDDSALEDSSVKSSDLLPLYRYSGITIQKVNSCTGGNILTSLGTCLVGSLSGNIATGVTSTEMSLAASFWRMTADLVSFAISSDVLNKMANKIDILFLNIARSVDGFLPGSSGGSAMLFIFVFVSALIMVLIRNNLSSKTHVPMIRLVATMIIPLAFLESFALAVNNNADAYSASENGNSIKVYNFSPSDQVPTNTQSGTVTGTPAWVAINLSNFMNSLVSGIATSPTLIDTLFSEDKMINVGNEKDNILPCTNYYKTLYETYKHSTGISASKDANSATKNTFNTNYTIMLLSMLYQKSYLDSFTKIQFGDSLAGQNAICHYAETNSEISPGEQALISNMSYNTYKFDYKNFQSNLKDNSVLYERGAAWYLWSACSSTASKNTPMISKPWAVFSSDMMDKTSVMDDKTRVKLCKDLIKGVSPNDDIKTWFNFGDGDNIPYSSDGNSPNAASLTFAEKRELKYAGHMASSLFANDTASKATLSLYTTATALFMLIFIGGLALGTIFSGVALAILLIFLPFTLFALSFPNKKSGGSYGSLGKRMLLLTVGFMGSKILLEFALFFIIAFSAILQNMLG